MTYNNIMTVIDEMAADFIFLSGREVDIPSAGKFLNQLEMISKIATELKSQPLVDVAGGITDILEKIIIDAVPDKDTGFAVIEKGISLLQEIATHYQNMGSYPGNTASFLAEVTSLTGYKPINEDSSSISEAQVLSPDSRETVEAVQSVQQPAAKMEVQDESLLKDFITEGLEYIEEIEVNILNLEQNPEDKEIFNTIFRPFHSVKGVAGFLNLDEIRDLSHCLENLLDKARNGNLSVTPNLIDVVLDGADTLKSMIGALRDNMEGKGQTQSSFDLAPLKMRINQVENGFEPARDKKRVGEILVENGIVTKEGLDDGLKIASMEPVKKIGEVLIDQGIATPKQVSQALRKQAEQVVDASTIRVDTRKLDDLIDMVGELVITHSIIQQDIANQVAADRNLMRDIGQLTRITAGLQQASTILRMVPIKQTFQRMSRLVRDLAKSGGKIVSVEMVGEDTEIDRNMVDEIYNPLVHLVRNSVDHGLESPEERIRLGKPDKGLIELKAYHRGGNIVIEIGDDGRGLN
ncbi:MAG: Hpt domain-containing protein, partial [Syntrophales bacterium]|nr:Hpt domain-containing protein [Syntrophales bacterium]